MLTIIIVILLLLYVMTTWFLTCFVISLEVTRKNRRMLLGYGELYKLSGSKFLAILGVIGCALLFPAYFIIHLAWHLTIKEGSAKYEEEF